MSTSDQQRREWIMECVKYANNMKIKIKITRNYVTFEFPDVTSRKKALKKKREAANA